MNFIGIIAGLIIYTRTNSILFAILAYYIINLLVKQFSNQNKSGTNNSQRRRQDFQRQFQQQYQQQNSNYYQQRISKNDFATALLVLSATVMKSDGNPLKSELNYVKQFFQQQFSPDFAQQQMLAFRDILLKCDHPRDNPRTLTSQIIYTDKNTSGIQPKALSKKQMRNFIDYLLNNPEL